MSSSINLLFLKSVVCVILLLKKLQQRLHTNHNTKFFR